MDIYFVVKVFKDLTLKRYILILTWIYYKMEVIILFQTLKIYILMLICLYHEIEVIIIL